MSALTKWEMAHLAGCLATEICSNYRDRHLSALARTWVHIYIPILRKLRVLTQEEAA